MAGSSISVLTDIQAFTPVYNRMEVCVNETDVPTKALTGYQYLIDVYIENVSGYKRFQVPKDPINGYGFADIGPYCEAACNWTLAAHNGVVPFSLGANADGTQSVIKVTIKYGYSYLLAGVYTVVADTVTATAKYAFQGSLTERAFMGWAYNTYICNIANGASGQFLTDMKTNYVSIANLGWHHILSDTPTDVDYLTVKTYSGENFTGLIQTATKAISVVQNLTSSRMFKVTTGPKSLNNMTGAFVAGAQPIVTAAVKSYTVQLTNSAAAVCSEILYFVIEEPCRYTQRRVHFGNRFGSFDAYNFNLRSQNEEETRRTSYKKNNYPIVTAGISRLYQDSAQVVNYVENQEFLTVRSAFLTTAQNDWLKQLVQSPAIYLEFTDPTGAQNYLAYEMVTQSSWVEKETSIDKLWILELKLKLSQTGTRQRR